MVSRCPGGGGGDREALWSGRGREETALPPHPRSGSGSLPAAPAAARVYQKYINIRLPSAKRYLRLNTRLEISLPL